ncbi:DEKNAAC100411 [Brettanomyces naardenensis]|uniref:DEKNAAC100411 n=1 Tax=Brettanomyces naardenensis TaxID=13370 RepID=A0A448YEJ6_BRENA|nr:DEKNAAC100411 [Brettanomyces naardenensis]
MTEIEIEEKAILKGQQNTVVTEFDDLQDNASIASGHEYIPEYADEYNPEGFAIALPEDRHSYRAVSTRPPYVCYLILLVEFAERGSYYGVQGILNNFIMRPLPEGSKTGRVYHDNDSAGALNMGIPAANGLTMLLQFMAYVMPLFGGYMADSKIGKFKAIMIGVWIGLISHIIFVIAAIPSVIAGGKALAAIIIAILSLSVGTGFIKPNLLPLLLDQYPYRCDVLQRLPSGEVVYVDRQRSMETITMTFYWSINIGAFLEIGTSYAARDVGYWLAFLCPGILYLLVCFVMLWAGPKLKKEVPKGSILTKVGKVLRVCFRGAFVKRLLHGQFWSYGFPSNMNARGEEYYIEKKQKPISWTDQDVRDFHVTFLQCVLFLYWVFFNLNDTGLGSSLNAQAGAMTTKNVPNDLFNNFNQITIVVLIPILDYIVYPMLIKYKINFKVVYKIFVGFMLGAFSSMVGAILQWRVYETSPCGWYASNCDKGVSPLTAWYDVIVYALAAAGECFCYTEAYELAYTRAPDNSKGLVMALFLLMNALSAAISEAVSAALVDPYLIYPFAAIAIAGAIAAVVFLIQYWNLEDTMKKEELEKEAARKDANDRKEKDIASSTSATEAEIASIA